MSEPAMWHRTLEQIPKHNTLQQSSIASLSRKKETKKDDMHRHQSGMRSKPSTTMVRNHVAQAIVYRDGRGPDRGPIHPRAAPRRTCSPTHPPTHPPTQTPCGSNLLNAELYMEKKHLFQENISDAHNYESLSPLGLARPSFPA